MCAPRSQRERPRQRELWTPPPPHPGNRQRRVRSHVRRGERVSGVKATHAGLEVQAGVREGRSVSRSCSRGPVHS